MGPKWVSVLLLMDGSFLPLPLKKGTFPFPPTPIRVTERPLLKHRNFSVIIGGAGGPMAKGGTKSTQCCRNSVGDASASLRTNDRGFRSTYKYLYHGAVTTYSSKKMVSSIFFYFDLLFPWKMSCSRILPTFSHFYHFSNLHQYLKALIEWQPDDFSRKYWIL